MKNIYHIAAEYFSGKIAEKDLQYLQSWLKNSPENKVILEELEKIWQLTGELTLKLKPDIEAEWSRFTDLRSLDVFKEFAGENKITPLFIKYLRIAAVIIPFLLIISFGILKVKQHNDQNIWLTAQSLDKIQTITLSDESLVWLNKHSIFMYPKRFSNNLRSVRLEGEAFFKVTKGASFKVGTEKTQVVVLGTEFSVRAYKQEKFTEVFVRKGRVRFEEKLQNSQKILLIAGEKGIYNESSKGMYKAKVTDNNLVAWKEDRLSFQNTPLSEIQSMITRYFNIQVQVTPSMEQCKFTGDFIKPRLNEMLDIISVSLGASYIIKNDTVFLKGQGCNH